MNSAQSKSSSPGVPQVEDKYFYNEEHGLPAIMELFDGHIGKNVLEIGSGTGAIAEYLYRGGRSVVSVEPEAVLAKRVRERFSHNESVTVIEKDSVQAYKELKEQERKFDTVIYVSVLEHIADDLREFKLAKDVLTPGGKILIFVPALPFLYSPIDANTGHIRRYTKKRFEQLIQDAELEITLLKYFETVGILPYLIVYKILRRQTITDSSTGLYNNVILPLSLFFYRLTRDRLVGKNLVLIAGKAK